MTEMNLGPGFYDPADIAKRRASGEVSLRKLNSLLPVLLKVPLRLVPSIPMMLMAATAISAAISPYSIAVTPALSLISFQKNARNGFSRWFNQMSAAKKK
jgi:hypothetical protein